MLLHSRSIFVFFFFNDTATTEIYTLSLHDALPILPDELWAKMEPLLPPRPRHPLGCHNPRVPDRAAMDAIFFVDRKSTRLNSSHRQYLVCRLLLEKKNQNEFRVGEDVLRGAGRWMR